MPAKIITLICTHCGEPFTRTAGEVRRFNPRFHSSACYGAWHMRPAVERFWDKVDTSGECWVWTGFRAEQNYGRIRLGGQGSANMTVHRFSWELHFGPIPAGLWVLHRCDNKACVRPDHLFLGTAADNSADRDAKGRGIAEERHWATRLTVEDVRTIRALAASGVTHTVIASQFGLTRSAVTAIHTRKNWKHVA